MFSFFFFWVRVGGVALGSRLCLEPRGATPGPRDLNKARYAPSRRSLVSPVLNLLLMLR